MSTTRKFCRARRPRSGPSGGPAQTFSCALGADGPGHGGDHQHEQGEERERRRPPLLPPQSPVRSPAERVRARTSAVSSAAVQRRGMRNWIVHARGGRLRPWMRRVAMTPPGRAARAAGGRPPRTHTTRPPVPGRERAGGQERMRRRGLHVMHRAAAPHDEIALERAVEPVHRCRRAHRQGVGIELHGDNAYPLSSGSATSRAVRPPTIQSTRAPQVIRSAAPAGQQVVDAAAADETVRPCPPVQQAAVPEPLPEAAARRARGGDCRPRLPRRTRSDAGRHLPLARRCARRDRGPPAPAACETRRSRCRIPVRRRADRARGAARATSRRGRRPTGHRRRRVPPASHDLHRRPADRARSSRPAGRRRGRR